jgi:hypothetical protein
LLSWPLHCPLFPALGHFFGRLLATATATAMRGLFRPVQLSLIHFPRLLATYSHTVIRFVSISAKFGICTVVGLNGTLVKLNAHLGHLNVRLLAKTSVLIRPTTVKMPYLALIETKWLSVRIQDVDYNPEQRLEFVPPSCLFLATYSARRQTISSHWPLTISQLKNILRATCRPWPFSDHFSLWHLHVIQSDARRRSLAGEASPASGKDYVLHLAMRRLAATG